MKYVIRIGALAAFLGFATAQIAAGYFEIDHRLGYVWALAAVLAAVLVRFTLPITVAALFGAMHLWGWHWPLAVAFTIPGLFLSLPGSIRAVISLSTEGASKLTSATPICSEH